MYYGLINVRDRCSKLKKYQNTNFRVYYATLCLYQAIGRRELLAQSIA